MADVPISLYTSVVKLTGENVAPPSLPPSLEETQPAINPPGTSDISGLVPYNGAIDNVNLGEKGLSTGFVQYDNTPTDTPTGAGTVVWNPDKYTLDLSMGLGDSVQQIGMETYYTPVKNQTGSLIPDGTFVMATGSLGASGRITVAPAVTDGSVDSRYMLGVTTHDIANGGDGLVTWFGEIRGFNTNTKAPVGETWIDGTVLWNNHAVAGGFTSVEPQAPNLKIPVAIVISSGNNGVIFVRPRLGMRLTDLHDVDAFTPSDKDLISYDSALGHWNAKSLGSVIGGTSSQFLKGDGSLDSNSYALSSSISGTTNYIPKFTASGTIGDSALISSADGVYNTGKGNSTFFGYRAGFNDDGTDNANTFIGYTAGISNTTGIFNSFVGLNAGLNNTTGNFNSFIGVSAGQNNTTGTNNSFIGVNAGLNNTTGNSNSFIGLNAGLNNTTGTNNSFIGVSAGRTISSGANLTIANNSIFLGFNTRANADNQTNQIVIGFSADGGGSNTTTIGNTSTVSTRIPAGSLWIGTTSGTNTLDVNGTARIRTLSNATGDFVTASATGVLQKRTASETLADIGAQGTIAGTLTDGFVATIVGGVPTWSASAASKWTDVGSDIYRNSAVAIGRTTIPTNATFAVQSRTATSAHKFIQYLNNSGSELYSLTQAGIALFTSPLLNIGNATTNIADGGPTIKGGVVNGDNSAIFRVNSSTNTSIFEVRSGRGIIVGVTQSFFGGLPSTNRAAGGPTIKGGVVNGNTGSLFNILTSAETLLLEVRPNYFISYSSAALFGNPSTPISNGAHFKGNANNTSEIFVIDNSSNSRVFSLLGNGDITYFDGSDWSFGTVTGTKIATANTQKLAFWNANPIVQPLETALANTPNTGDTDTDNLITALKNIILNTGLGRAS